jgi:hypothetical protein
MTGPRLIRTPQDLVRAVRALHTSTTDGTATLIDQRDVTSEGTPVDFAEGGQHNAFLRYRLTCSTCEEAFEVTLCGNPSAWPSKAEPA